MNQSNNFSGKPIIRQLLDLIPRDLVYRTAAKHQSDHYVKRFKTYDHLMTMLYAVLSDCTSIRELSTAMLACEGKLKHLGIDYFPKRSTLSDANRRRSEAVFGDIYYGLLERYRHLLSDSSKEQYAGKKVFIVDATTITLFKDVLKAGSKAVNGKKKGGLKIHSMIRASEDVPSLVNLTNALWNDVNLWPRIKLPSDSWLVFDRGYNNYDFFNHCTKQGWHFVTRQMDNSVYDVIEEFERPQEVEPLIKDQHIHIIRDTSKRKVKLCLRRIAWFDHERQKRLVFITNNFDAPAATIAALYKNRWQIETLFKRLKQNFSIKYFLGDSANAVKIQVWVALIAHLILKVVQLQAKRRWAFSNLAALVRYHLISYIRLFDFLKNPFASFEVLTSTDIQQSILFPP